MENTSLNIREQYWLWASLLLWALQSWQGLTWWHWQMPPFFFVGADNTQWLAHLLYLIQIPVQWPWLGGCLSLGLWLWPCWILWRREDRFPRYALLGSWIWYYLTYNALAGHHSHVWLGPIILSLASCFPKEEGLWRGLRLYVCFMLFSAGCWKVWRGSVWEEMQMVHILEAQHGAMLAVGGWQADWIGFWLARPTWAALWWYGACVLELAFGLGFWTRRWDRYLAWALVAFLVFDALLMQLYFYPWLPLVLVFGATGQERSR
jgi:hypothetical protein